MATITAKIFPGIFNVGNTWVGDVAPIATDDIVIDGAVVTTDANTTFAGGSIGVNGELVFDGYDSNINGNMLLAGGKVTQNTGGGVEFGAGFDIIYSTDTGEWDINGTIGVRTYLRGAVGSGFGLQSGSSDKVVFTPTYADITRFGRADSTGNHAIHINSNGEASVIEFNNCKIDTYWRMRFGQGWTPAVDATFKFTKSSFFNPQDPDIFEYTCTANFNANTRGLWDCTFVGSAANNKVLINNAGTSWTNKFVISNCYGEDIRYINTLGAPVELTSFGRCVDYIGSGNDIFMATVNDGQWHVHDTVVATTRNNAHTMSATNGDIGGGIVEDCVIQGENTGDNHYGFDAGVIYRRNIAVGGQHTYSTRAGAGLPQLTQHTHINKVGNADSLIIQETTNFIPNAITIHSCLMIGVNAAASHLVDTDIGTDQDYKFIDHMCYWQVTTPYNNITVANDTIAQGQPGFGGNDINADPQMLNKDANIQTWDLSLGGPGTLDHAYGEVLKVNGFDRDGNAATFDSNFTRENYLTYIRNQLAPRNIALQGAGYLGVDMGALSVIIAAAVGSIRDNILRATSGSTVNEGLSTWFSRTASESLGDAARRWLLAKASTTSGSNRDLWYEFLRDEGYSGAVNDMLLSYWRDQP